MDILKKTLNTTAAVALTAALAFSVTAAKAETVTGNASIVVLNAFTLLETTPLSFGTKIMQNHVAGTDVATLAIDVAGVETITNATNARFVNIATGAQGVYDVTNAAPNAAINVTLPTTSTLSCGGCTGGNPVAVASSFVDDSALGVLTTDGTGAATLNVGATLTTEASNAALYEDNTYSGTFVITMNY